MRGNKATQADSFLKNPITSRCEKNKSSGYNTSGIQVHLVKDENLLDKKKRFRELLQEAGSQALQKPNLNTSSYNPIYWKTKIAQVEVLAKKIGLPPEEIKAELCLIQDAMSENFVQSKKVWNEELSRLDRRSGYRRRG